MCVAALAATLPAQSIVPAKAGLVSYADEAYIDDRPLEISTAHFFRINENAVMRTGAGRAEVLLGPCAAMWIDENSSFRIISNELSDVRLEVLTGSVLVATAEMVKGTRLSLLLKTSVAPLDPKGAYRFDAGPPRVKVLAGRASVQWENRTIAVNAGQLLQLDRLAEVGKFDKRNPDPLENWSRIRAALLLRLSRLHTGNSPDPAAPGDIVLRGPRSGTSEIPPPTIPLPAPLPPGSGCVVAPW